MPVPPTNERGLGLHVAYGVPCVNVFPSFCQHLIANYPHSSISFVYTHAAAVAIIMNKTHTRTTSVCSNVLIQSNTS